MSIVPPPDDPRHPAPSDGLGDLERRPLASSRRTGRGCYEVTLHPGTDVADVIEVFGAVPLDAIFVETFGDVDAVLVFRPIPPAASSAVAAGSGGPAPADLAASACLELVAA